MESMTTTQRQGTMPGRARIDAFGLRVSATGLSMRSWPAPAPAFLGCTTTITGGDAVPTNSYAKHGNKRTARHLGPGST